MKVFYTIFYLISLCLFGLSLITAYSDFDYNIFFNNKYGIFTLITGFSFSLISFNLREIIDSFKTIMLSRKVNESEFRKNELVIKSIWKYIFNSSILYSLIISIIFLSQPDKYILGNYLSNILNIMFYILFTKMFIFKPLEISIMKRAILEFKRIPKTSKR